MREGDLNVGQVLALHDVFRKRSTAYRILVIDIFSSINVLKAGLEK